MPEKRFAIQGGLDGHVHAPTFCVVAESEAQLDHHRVAEDEGPHRQGRGVGDGRSLAQRPVHAARGTRRYAYRGHDEDGNDTDRGSGQGRDPPPIDRWLKAAERSFDEPI